MQEIYAEIQRRLEAGEAISSVELREYADRIEAEILERRLENARSDP